MVKRLIGRFIKAALLYFTVGSSMGIVFIAFPQAQAFIHDGPGSVIKWVHVHVNLLGWVTTSLFALIYFGVPKITGRPLFSERLAYLHFWLFNIGLVGMLALSSVFGYVGGNLHHAGIPEGQIYGAYTGALISALLFALVMFAGILVFVFNVWFSLSADD